MKKMKALGCLLLALMLMFPVGCSRGETESEITSYIVVVEEEDVQGDSTDTKDDGNTATTSSGKTGTSSSQSTKESTQSDNKINMSDPENPYKDVPAKLKNTSVTFLMYWEPNARDKSKFRSFEKTTGIKVKTIVSPDVQTKLASLIASGNSPDVVRYSFWPAGIDLLQNLSVAKMNLSDPVWDQSILKATTFKGQPYGINTFGETNLNSYIAYNEDMFHDNGFDSPGDYYKAGKWNTETFETACRDIKSLGNDYVGFVSGDRMELIRAAGIDGIVSWKNGKFISNLTESKFVEGLRFIAQGVKEGFIMYDWTPGCEKFVGNRVGMIASTNYGLEKEGFFKGIKFKLGAVPIPEPKGSATYDKVYGLDAFGVPQGAKNPEGAGYFMRYYLDPVRDEFDTLFFSKEIRDFHLNQIKTAKTRVIDPSSSVLPLSGDTYLISDITWVAATTDPQQVAATLNSYKNMVDKAVVSANAHAAWKQ